jgi:DNA-binding transcriptional MocR family regulator
LATGNPSAALLPPLAGVLRRIETSPVLYGEGSIEPALLKLGERIFRSEGVAGGRIAVVGGALDGVERVLREHLRTGDRVAVEDPGFQGVHDLVTSMGLKMTPMAVDDEGPTAEGLGEALERGAKGLIVTPRAQNPFGSALSARRVRELEARLKSYPEALVIEDDHAGEVAGAPARTLCGKKRRRWAVVRSFSKALGPDLRTAIMIGDERTIARVQGRQVMGSRWVSFLLQRLVVALMRDKATAGRLRRARETYAKRRKALIEAFAERGMEAHGRSGFNIWVAVRDENAAVRAMAEAGWAVSAGERFRLQSEPAVRITISSLAPKNADALAGALASSLERAVHYA